MTSFYDEVEIEDMDFDEDLKTYFYPCPCGDRFQITLEEIYDGDEVGICPSCSLIIRIIYDADDYQRDDEEKEIIKFS